MGAGERVEGQCCVLSVMGEFAEGVLDSSLQDFLCDRWRDRYLRFEA